MRGLHQNVENFLNPFDYDNGSFQTARFKNARGESEKSVRRRETKHFPCDRPFKRRYFEVGGEGLIHVLMYYDTCRVPRILI